MKMKNIKCMFGMHDWKYLFFAVPFSTPEYRTCNNCGRKEKRQLEEENRIFYGRWFLDDSKCWCGRPKDGHMHSLPTFEIIENQKEE